MQTSARGAYGLTVAGLESQDHALSAADPNWPLIRVVMEGEPPRDDVATLTSSRAVFPTGEGGTTFVEREAGFVRFVGPLEPEPTAAVHPRLGMVGAVYAQWLGRDAFHAGAFTNGGGAWAVVGEREAGKSTLLAALAIEGFEIITDDTLVVDDGLCFSGVRCIDLRMDAPEHLGVADLTVEVRSGQRRRLLLEAPPAPTPLAGWVFLRWATDLALRPIPPADRVSALGGLSRWNRRGVTDPRRLLALAALPAWELCRPRDWSSMPVVVEALLSDLED